MPASCYCSPEPSRLEPDQHAPDCPAYEPDADSGLYPPGVWADGFGALHFDIEAMVRGAGFEPTPDNLRAMEQAARDMAAQIGASFEVYE